MNSSFKAANANPSSPKRTRTHTRLRPFGIGSAYYERNSAGIRHILFSKLLTML